MKRQVLGGFVVAIVFLALNVRGGSAEIANAAPRNTYEISWYTIDGGAAMNLTGGTYSLGGTIGQPDAGAQNGGAYTLRGGFWGMADLFRVLLPIILKNY